jgi:hypothetical protein
MHFPPPVGAVSGYRFLPSDMPGGADGDPAFRWAQPHAVAAVRLAAHETTTALGPGPEPMAIFDLSAENGDTPIDWAPGKPGRGRHPGGSHDGGLNLDVGYYLASLKGRVLDPDYAACTDHHDLKPDGQWVEASTCRGPADRLDVPRQALFFLRLFRLNREDFDNDLLEEVGLDLQVRDRVLSLLRGWIKDGRHDATMELLADMERTFTSDAWEGWSGSHHHHAHLRFRDTPTRGRHRAAVERLMTRERNMDAKLAATLLGQSVSLRARVLSSGLERAVEVQLLPMEEVARSARYRVGRGPWVDPDPSRRHHAAVMDLAVGPVPTDGSVTVQAELTMMDGERKVLEEVVTLPRQDPRLHVAVDAARLEVVVKRQGPRWSLGLLYPDAYRPYITAVQYQVFRGVPVEKPEQVEGPPPSFSATFQDDPTQPPVQLLRARVLLSGRQEVLVPTFVAAP